MRSRHSYPASYLRNFGLALSFYLAVSCACAYGESATTSIKLDQVGYLLNAQKIAFVTAGGTAASSFVVKQSSDNAVVLQGTLGAASRDPNTGDDVRPADFSALRKAGKYYIEVAGVGHSWNFSIGRDVYLRAYRLAMLGFYGQRCGAAVDLGPEFPGYKHPACHLKGAFSASSGKQGERNNIGGWHDAGDYGRYVVNSGISTGSLLWAWELYSSTLRKIKLSIPETGKGTPDLLSEARWNIEWMLKMQDEDGGAWHKQTSTHFSGFVMPEDDTLPSEVIGTGSAPYKSTCATADLAAVAAIAARVYKPFDAKFATQNLDAARKAWLWTEKNPNVTFRNPEGISTGEYGDDSCKDERVWAAAELWRTTGDAAYQDFFLKNYAEFLPKLDSPPAEDWRELAPMGLWTYALSNRRGADASAVAAIRNNSIAVAKRISQRTASDPYRVSLVAKDYVWGSNGVAASYGFQLLVANALAPDPAFVNAAMDNLH